uniref:Myomesin 3 n=1 Tax=Electrophorus electricus TaxID=8005 RepID=A0A4W4F8H2_ELEEL
QKGKTYRFRVRSVNKYGVSEPSEASQPVSLQEALGIPAAAHSVQAIRDTANSVLLQWKEPKNPEGILGYYLYCCELGTSEWRTINNKPVTCTRFTVHGLRTGKEYVFRVKSVGRAGNSRYSEESEPLRVRAAKLVPTAPSAISLLRCTGIEMVIAWRAPASNGGDPVRGYYLDQREKSQSTWSEVNVRPVKDRVYTVSGLREGHYYQFRAFAENLIGVGRPSVPSEAFLCEQWTMPVPGSPYDLELREVRQESLVLLWAEPLYQGQSAVTGYVVEISPGEESEDWTAVTKKPITDTQLKVSGLQGGQIYRLRVSAVNSAGVGRPSLPTEPIKAQTSPGSRDIEIGVDDDGFVFMSFEGPETADKGEVKWNKNYREPIEAGRVRLESKQNKCEDLGLYTHSHPPIDVFFVGLFFLGGDPVISLRSEGWQVEVLEQGAVRLWLQTEPLSKGAELRMILNDREISSTPARRIGFDRENGLVDILFNQLAKEDEGSYTAQLKDGRAKNQFTLVLVDESTSDGSLFRDFFFFLGPHFEEFLSWTVTNDCEMILKCKVIIQPTACVFELKFTPDMKPLHRHLGQCLQKELLLIHYGLLLTVILSVLGREKKIDQEERTKPGSSMQKVWIEIFSPTEYDKGKYTLQMLDGQETHTRSLDLSGQETWSCFFTVDRARVTKGLPDVVAIREDKSLCLTCFADGDPAPEMSWLKNDREIPSAGRYHIALDNKCSTLTIHTVNMEDSGNYSMFVRNKHGTETVSVTVSVYKHGEKPRADAIEM